MTRLFILVLAIASIFALSGCATQPVPPELQYQPPPANSESGMIVGSQENMALLDDFTAFVIGVDGKRVMVGRKGWNVPLALMPGNRRLVLEFNHGIFVSNAVMNVPVTLGDSLELRYSTDVAVYGKNSYCDFWVIDSKSGKVVTDIVRGTVHGGGNSTYIPIYIPKK